MLLSLVVIFTQSIQLSKIVRVRNLVQRYGPGARLRTCSSLNTWTALIAIQILKLEQVCFDVLRDNGGADRDRTDDILLAKQALSQLSYSPIATSITKAGGEEKWWAWIDSNYRPHPYQGCALAN